MLRLLPCLAGILLAGLVPAQTSYFVAGLRGEQEVPPTPSTGRGYGIVQLDEPANIVTVTLHTDVTAGNAAHIHAGARGVNGGVIFSLTFIAPGRCVTGGPMSAANVALLKTGGCYLNIHTPSFPGGEIRGQLGPATATRFSAALSGANEVPPNPSTETGAFYAYLYEPDNVLLCEASTSMSARVSASHIHEAAAGSNGPVIFPFTTSFPQCLAVEMTAAQVTTLKNSGFYFNIHSTAFPGGEIRGQITPGVGDFVAPMSGAQEVPPTPSATVGEFSVRLTANNELDYRGNTDAFTTARTNQHFHAAPAGVNGPVIININAPVGNTYTGVTRALTPAELVQVRAAGWYTNVHTTAFPGGEIRGQVVNADLPTVFGGGCRGSNNKNPVIGAMNAPVVGASFRIVLANATPARNAFLIFGTTRATPFPIPLDLINMNGCWLFHNDLGIAVSGTTDVNGCITRDVPIPFDVTLRGLQLYSSYFVIDPGGTNLGLSGSNALQWKVQ